MEKIYFTEAGLQQFLDKIEKDENVVTEMSARLGYLAEVGGDQYHDNFSYEQQTMELRMLTDKINKDRGILKNACIVGKSIKKNKQTVYIGATVTAEFDNNVQSWKILGYGESDPKRYQIAYNTPLGAQLIGKKVNAVFDFNFNSKRVRIRILKIE